MGRHNGQVLHRNNFQSCSNGIEPPCAAGFGSGPLDHAEEAPHTNIGQASGVSKSLILGIPQGDCSDIVLDRQTFQEANLRSKDSSSCDLMLREAQSDTKGDGSVGSRFHSSILW